MKTAAKAFIIIGMVFSAVMIYPIVLGIFALRALDNAKSHSDLTSWGVVTLIFVSLLGGIFMLCVKDEELNCNSQPTINTQNNFSEGALETGGETCIVNTKSSPDNSFDSDENQFITAILYDEL